MDTCEKTITEEEIELEKHKLQVRHTIDFTPKFKDEVLKKVF